VLLGEVANTPSVVTRYANLCSCSVFLGDMRRAREALARTQAALARFPSDGRARWFRGERPFWSYEEGDWDGAVAAAQAFVAEVAPRGGHAMEFECERVLALVLLGRDDLEAALRHSARALELGRVGGDFEALEPTLAVRARVLLAAGREAEAAALVDELRPSWIGFGAVELTVVLDGLGRRDELAGLAVRPPRTRWKDAALAVAQGGWGVAADRYAAIGSRPAEAYARLRAGGEDLERALALYRPMRATRYVGRAEAAALTGPTPA
jgi:hypothetical protein